MIKILHNPRCSKSREGLQILQNSGKDFEVIKYLEDIPSKQELKGLIEKLGIKPEQLVRKGETIWKEKYKDKKLSDEKIIEAMVAHPKLIERPIVINGNKVVLGRPPKKIFEII